MKNKADRQGTMVEYLESVYRRAKLFHPGLLKREYLWLLRQVVLLNPSTVLEVGSAFGGTLFGLMQVCPKDARLIAIDILGSRIGAPYSVEVLRYVPQFRQKHQQIHLLLANSGSPITRKRVKDLLGNSPLHFLFIDADHSYQAVKRDVAYYEPLVAVKGVIALHDIVDSRFHRSQGCEVARLWREMKRQKKYRPQEFFSHHGQQCGGIGWLEKLK